MLKLPTLWPFPEEQVSKICGRAKAIIVPELNQGQLRLEVGRVMGSQSEVIGINRVDELLIHPEQFLEAVRRIC